MNEEIKNTEEQKFLEGPRSRIKELMFLFNVMLEFLKGLRKLHFLAPCVTVFGSARFKEDHPYYKKAMEVGEGLAHLGFTVMTGGGPGIMEAANRGAKQAGGLSVGTNIVLPMEQTHNPYLDKWVYIKFFFVRKVLLSKYSYAFVVMPGGFGTLDEFFEALTLIQTNKIKRFPVVLIGKEYHQDLYNHFNRLQSQGTIDAVDKGLFLFTDSVEETMQYIEKNAIDQFGLRSKKKIKRLKLLIEKK